MAKRPPDRNLTHDNWDDEEASEEPGSFRSADDDTLKQRPMLKAKRRCTANNEGSAGSGVFASFTSLTGASKTTTFSEQHPLPVGSPRRVGDSLKSLNKDLMNRLQDRIASDPAADMRPVLSEYISSVEKLLAVSASQSDSITSMMSVTTSTTCDTTTMSADSRPSVVPLSELFSRPSDSWSCSTCFVSNKNSDDSCVACTSKRPSSSQQTSQPQVSVASSMPTLSEMFKKSSAEWDCKDCFVRNKQDQKNCVACGAAKSASNSEPESSSTSVAVSSISAPAPLLSSGFAFSVPQSTAGGTGFSFAPSGGFTATGGFSFRPPTAAASSASSSSASSAAAGGTASSGFTFSWPTGTSSSLLTTGGFKFTPPTGTGSSSSQPGETEGNSKDEEGEYTPPKPDPVPHSEEGAVYTVRCKLFYMRDGKWQDRGTCNLFLKPCDDKTQLIIRSDTCTGNVLLNIFLSSGIPFRREGENNVSLACVPNPPIDTQKSKKPVCMLIRVKTSEMADQLLSEINKYQPK